MYGIEVRSFRNREMTVELRGEFDLSSIDQLRQVLSSVASLRLPTTIDLSGVTFLDIQTTRELAVRSQLYAHHVTLLNPSWQVERSVRASKLADWIRFEYREERPNRSFLEKVS